MAKKGEFDSIKCNRTQSRDSVRSGLVISCKKFGAIKRFVRFVLKTSQSFFFAPRAWSAHDI